ncbi:MutS protein msh4 [Blastocladiella emersonii ATCC 22665]|nr:MutS protein msh4 [Blastocladiella emersonii ATCC 22665]
MVDPDQLLEVTLLHESQPITQKWLSRECNMTTREAQAALTAYVERKRAANQSVAVTLCVSYSEDAVRRVAVMGESQLKALLQKPTATVFGWHIFAVSKGPFDNLRVLASVDRPSFAVPTQKHSLILNPAVSRLAKPAPSALSSSAAPVPAASTRPTPSAKAAPSKAPAKSTSASKKPASSASSSRLAAAFAVQPIKSAAAAKSAPSSAATKPTPVPKASPPQPLPTTESVMIDSDEGSDLDDADFAAVPVPSRSTTLPPKLPAPEPKATVSAAAKPSASGRTSGGDVAVRVKTSRALDDSDDDDSGRPVVKKRRVVDDDDEDETDVPAIEDVSQIFDIPAITQQSAADVSTQQSDAMDVDAPLPASAPSLGRVKRRRRVKRANTYVDERGRLVTEDEIVSEEYSEDEVPAPAASAPSRAPARAAATAGAPPASAPVASTRKGAAAGKSKSKGADTTGDDAEAAADSKPAAKKGKGGNSSQAGGGGGSAAAAPSARHVVALFHPRPSNLQGAASNLASARGGRVTSSAADTRASGEVGLCVFDLTSSTCALSQFADSRCLVRTLGKLGVFPPAELVVPSSFYHPVKSEAAILLEGNLDAATQVIPVARKHFDPSAGMELFTQLALADSLPSLRDQVVACPHALSSLAALLKFIEVNHGLSFARTSIHFVVDPVGGTLLIDGPTSSALELVANQAGQRGHTLFAVMNRCCTVMGMRLLRSTILQPPNDPSTINSRHDAVDALLLDLATTKAIQDTLKRVPVMDRIISGLVQIPKNTSSKSAEREIGLIIDLRHTLRAIPPLLDILSAICGQRDVHDQHAGLNASSPHPALLEQVRTLLMEGAFSAMDSAISRVFEEDLEVESTPIGIRNQRAFAIRSGVHGLLDVSRRAYQESVADIHQLINDYAEEYQLALKAQFTAALGFSIEFNLDSSGLPRSTAPTEDADSISGTPAPRTPVVADLPPIFINVVRRRGTVRCTTLELMKHNERISESMGDIYLISDQIIKGLMEELRLRVGALYRLSEALALLDMLTSFAVFRASSDLVRPSFGDAVDIRQGRHPIQEVLLELGQVALGAGRAAFVPNDTHLNLCPSVVNEGGGTSAVGQSHIQVITGPNMAGKTTYVKQVALIAILAHIGSGVPAVSATVPLLDRILSRMAFGDSILTHSSTFAVEMRDTARIIEEVLVPGQRAPTAARARSVASSVAETQAFSPCPGGPLLPRDPPLPRAADRYTLVLIDELGRGTSPNEGAGLAYSAAEALTLFGTNAIVLFVTHFFEVPTMLLRAYPGLVTHSHLGMSQRDDQLAFDRGLISQAPGDRGPALGATDEGGAGAGYGIELAQVLPFPKSVMDAATFAAKLLEPKPLGDSDVAPLGTDAGQRSASPTNTRASALLGLARDAIALGSSPDLATVRTGLEQLAVAARDALFPDRAGTPPPPPSKSTVEQMARATRSGNLDMFYAALSEFDGEPATLLHGKDGSGSTLVHIAAEYANPAVLEALLSMDPSILSSVVSAPAATPDRNTPLHLAASPRVDNNEAASLECVQLLLAAGANPRAKNKAGELPGDTSPHPKVRAVLRQRTAVGGSDLALDADDADSDDE